MRSFILRSFLIIPFLSGCTGGGYDDYDDPCDEYDNEDCAPTDEFEDDDSPADASPSGFCDLTIAEDGIVLPLQGIYQQCQQWCWAATIQMVVSYYGSWIDQCVMASTKSGFSYNECCNYAACSYQACNQPARTDEMVAFLSALGIYGYQTNRALTDAEIQLELSSGRPIIAALQGAFIGHVVVLSGFVPATESAPAFYNLIDPYYGEFAVSRDDLIHNYQASWTASFWKLSDRDDGCGQPVNANCECH